MKLLGAILLAVSLAAVAADEPEVVYGKFHRAIASGDLDGVMEHAPAARRAEIAAMSGAQKDAQIKMLSMMLPKAFKLVSKNVAPDGKRARLLVTGPSQPPEGGRAQAMYGDVKMVNEGGVWKVEELSWSSEKPEGADMQAGQASAAPAKKAPAKPAPAAAKTPAPEPKPAAPLGEAKPDCVYKPVMTDEDMKRCR